MTTPLLTDPNHQSWLRQQAVDQFDFFRASLNPAGGFFVLDHNGSPLPGDLQELHTTTRLVHAYAPWHAGRG